MARRRQGSEIGAILGGMVVLIIAFYVLKWLLITAAILAVPFGLWWLYDYAQRREPAAGG